jgi:hypothetical protein
MQRQKIGVHPAEQTAESVKRNKRKKIIVLGVSHARGCARELSSCLGKEFEVNVTVMPGAGLAHITTLAQEEILNLTPGDAVVI